MPRLSIVFTGALILLASTALATDDDPASHIQRPPGKGPTYVVATAGGGALADGDQPRPGYTVSAVLRPPRAADFANALYAWNTALVLQVDKQGGGPATIISGDLIMRHYLGDMRQPDAGRAWFVGMGAGISHARWEVFSGDDDQAPVGGAADAFTFLVEAGLEWNLDPALVLVGKAQYRLYDRGGHDLSGWTLQGGLGLPFPF